MQINSKADAQKRVDQITSFQNELAALEEQKIIRLDDKQSSTLNSFHSNLIQSLASQFDIDASKREKQLSLGMRITSFLGALALAASVYFLFYKFWGRLSTFMQCAILTTAPLAGLFATIYASYREKTGYFSKLLGMVTLACFVLNLVMLGNIFNITPSENAFFVWALFAFFLAYASDTRLLLGVAIICIAGFLSAKTGTFWGCYWINFGQRPENFFPASVLIFSASFLPHYKYSGFKSVYRVFGMLLFFIPMLVLSNWGEQISYLMFANNIIENIYQVAGFVFSAMAIWVGIKHNWGDVTSTGNVFFSLFLYTKFYDWWWDFLPKYLFFGLIGIVAMFMLLVFKRLRNIPDSNKAQKETS